MATNSVQGEECGQEYGFANDREAVRYKPTPADRRKWYDPIIQASKVMIAFTLIGLFDQETEGPGEILAKQEAIFHEDSSFS